MDKLIRMERDKGVGYFSITMEMSILVFGKIMVQWMVTLSLKMEIALKELFVVANKTMAGTSIPMGISTKDNGKMMSNVDLAR